VASTASHVPHLTVAENVAYPLRIRGTDRAGCDARADALLDLAKLPEVRDRRIHGQTA